jgi:hypothetical protein
MRILAILIGMLLMALLGSSQGNGPGSLQVTQDPMLDSLLLKYSILRAKILDYEDNKGIPGYRIQIFFDSGANSGERARKAKEEFELVFPDIPGYVTWKSPNFRVRVGDFRTRLEAEKALKDISREYPNAWVIKDEINYPPIL